MVQTIYLPLIAPSNKKKSVNKNERTEKLQFKD